MYVGVWVNDNFDGDTNQQMRLKEEQDEAAREFDNLPTCVCDPGMSNCKRHGKARGDTQSAVLGVGLAVRAEEWDEEPTLDQRLDDDPYHVLGGEGG